jgi:hypothetical protein
MAGSLIWTTASDMRNLKASSVKKPHAIERCG